MSDQPLNGMPPLNFEVFAREFVHKYWETVKNREFPMPPDEPVEETLKEILSQVSFEIELESSAGPTKPLHKLRMMYAGGMWWLFTFRESAGQWELVGCSAKSDDDERPHDLLHLVYSRWFSPFLSHVTKAAHAINTSE